MARKRFVVALACFGALGLASGDRVSIFAQDSEEPNAPAVLSIDEDEPLENQAFSEKADVVEEIPPTALRKAPPLPKEVEENLGASAPNVIVEPFSDDEMRALSNQPLFKEFTHIIDETSPLPDDVDVQSLGVPGAELMLPPGTPGSFFTTARTAPGELNLHQEQLLDETLAIADIDLESYEFTPTQILALESIDAEIGRLWPLWIDAEINRNVVGRRERDWRLTDSSRFTTNAAKTIDVPGSDWALALDEPFWFQVVDLTTNENYFTKAGDFETLETPGFVALIRGGRLYSLVTEEGRVRPTGRAMRVKIRKNGRIQGVDASGNVVTDVNLGEIPLFMFQNPARLESGDGVFFTPTPGSGGPQRVNLTLGTKIGVMQHRLALSNGDPEEILARICVLCKTKARLFELITHTSASEAVVQSEEAIIIPSGTDAVLSGAELSPIPETTTIPNDERVQSSQEAQSPSETWSEGEIFTLPDDESFDLILPDIGQ